MTYSGFSTFFKAFVPSTLSVVALSNVVSNFMAFGAARDRSAWAIDFDMSRLTAIPAVFWRRPVNCFLNKLNENKQKYWNSLNVNQTRHHWTNPTEHTTKKINENDREGRKRRCLMSCVCSDGHHLNIYRANINIHSRLSINVVRKKERFIFLVIVTSNRRAKRPSTGCYHVGRARRKK